MVPADQVHPETRRLIESLYDQPAGGHVNAIEAKLAAAAKKLSPAPAASATTVMSAPSVNGEARR
jgi:hypothetical protein